MCRVQYTAWKEECREMDSHVGSGKIITAPIITEEGVPIQDPLVLLQAVPNQAAQADLGSSGDLSSNKSHVDPGPIITDKKVIQWKLTLHQIGRH